MLVRKGGTGGCMRIIATDLIDDKMKLAKPVYVGNCLILKKGSEINHFRTLNKVPAMGLEPIRGCPRQILSLMRLPFRHAGM